MKLWARYVILATAALLGAGAWVYFHPLPPLGYGDHREDEVFADCAECPELTPIAPGRFFMGSAPRREVWLAKLGLEREAVRTVFIERPFAIGRYEVTFAQWDACTDDGGCNGYYPSDEGWGRGDLPVVNVSWNDAQAYVDWLSRKTGHSYRLPSGAEWEYAARAGTQTPYSWGKTPSRKWANYGGPDCPPCSGHVSGRDRWRNTAPVGQFPPNRFGLFDVHGNVYEWVEDCFTYPLPAGAATAAPVRREDCRSHDMRGSAYYSNAERITSHYRAHNPPEHRAPAIGFRVARSL